ncbi:MAG: RNase III inhibitor [Ruminococcaceae bacterium]|nr:RNase III inhibitor [Oscillospiraceae bacterium]
MPFTIVRQDITRINAHAIVNAANTDLKMGGGVCGSIFKAAGAEQLQDACNKLAPINLGDAVITPGFNLPAKYVIHAAGPVYKPWNKKESERLLRAAYTNALIRAVENSCESIAFPLISSGIYGYPKEEALKVASSAIKDFLTDHELDVTLAVFDKKAFAVSRKLLGEVECFIDEHYVGSRKRSRRQLLYVERQIILESEEPSWKQEPQLCGGMSAELLASNSIDNLIGKLDEPFSEMLLRLIDAKGMTDVDVYKRANLSRKLFSKIRTGKGYMPGKRTVIALAVALKLSVEETDSLLKRAGYALSHAVIFDVIVEYFILHGQYDIFKINEVLFAYDQPLLGA